MNKDEMFEVFGDFDPADYEEEVRRRFDPALVAESERRTSKYTKQDWERIKAEQEEITAAISERMDSGPDDPEVQTLIERHRRFIDENFYPCSLEVHAGLGETYVADARFAEAFDAIRLGLAEFMRDAMRLNADRNFIVP